LNVLAHVDPLVLERELLARVDAAHPRGTVAATLVLVPTERLVEHVLRRLATVRPAWLGLRVLSFPSLAGDVLERSSGGPPRVAHPLLLEALLRRLLDQRRTGSWCAFVRRRPGAAGRLLEALGDLREAGIEPADLTACAAADAATDDLAELYARYHTALEAAAARGWTDAAGVARAARPHVAAFAADVRAVFVHGAYEILGVYLDLIGAFDRATEVTALVPVAPGTRVTAYAERFADGFLGGPIQAIEARGAAVERAARLAALYEEESTPPAAAAGAFRFRHAQGAGAEVKYAVREALASVQAGCPPAEIAIVARSLEPYAAAIEEAFEDEELPWTSALGSPLRRRPLVRELLLLLRVVADGFPRDLTVELLHARHLFWEGLGCLARPSPAEADRTSREAGIIEGLEEWTADLEAWAALPRPESSDADEPSRRTRRIEGARRIGDALRRVDAAVPQADARWSEHAATLERLLASGFRADDEAARDALGEILHAMEDLERFLDESAPVPFATMRAWFERAVDATRLAPHREDNGGIRVLDAMQMRGCTFREVHLLGLNAGLFPRAPRADPFLGDAVRRALRERTGRPIRVEAETGDEEHLLLALLAGGAAERLHVSWQRADESGRAKVASLALRELARVALGRADLELAKAEAEHLPSHPRQWLERLVQGPGLLAPGEAMLLAALTSRAPDAAALLAQRFPDLEPGLAMLRATQSFTPMNGDFDARIGPIAAAPAFSVTGLEVLGRCPLQYFFKQVLRVAEPRNRASAFELEPNEMGSRVHELLQEIWEGLRAEGAFAGEADRLVRRGLELLEERRERVLGEIGTRQARRLPRLWERVGATWFETVRRFLEDDLQRVADEGLSPARLEERVEVVLDLGEGLVVALRGKFDRLLEGPRGWVVGDYKTSRRLAPRVETTQMLKGLALQVPLYALMAGAGTSVELLAVHPDVDPADGTHRARFTGFSSERVERSFRQTLRVLVRLHRDGSFPFHADDAHCRWCAFEQACPRNHPPTQDREEQLADGASYRQLRQKSETKPDVA
jgi:ATP-dependent helicase/nuclease subunit B